MHTKAILLAVAGSCLFASLPFWAQTPSSGKPLLMRMERQTREEDVCILLHKDGHYHLERVTVGRSRVFEGTLESPAISELDALLNSEQLINIKQAQIEAAGGDLDQVLIAISRPAGWQSLNFPSSKSRKPFRAALDPVLNWLDRTKQQPDPIAGATPNRCVPPQATQAAGKETKPSATNPYLVRMVVDRYEPRRLDASADTNPLGGGTMGGMNSSPNAAVYSGGDFKITRLCAIVYESGRYRLERSVQEGGTPVRLEIYRDSLDKGQLQDLRQILDNPRLSALPSRAAPPVFAREGEVTSLIIPREKNVQALSFASFFSTRTPEATRKDAALLALSVDVDLTHPIRKWVKQNVEEHKSQQLKDVPSTVCVPSGQPE